MCELLSSLHSGCVTYHTLALFSKRFAACFSFRKFLFGKRGNCRGQADNYDGKTFAYLPVRSLDEVSEVCLFVLFPFGVTHVPLFHFQAWQMPE